MCIRDRTYTLDPSLTVPSDVQIGRRITVYSSPVDGSLRVQRITMVESTNPDGSKQTRTETRDEPGVPPPSSMSGSTGSTGANTQTTTTTQSSSAYSAQQPPADVPAQTETQTTKTTKTLSLIHISEPTRLLS